VAYRVLAVNQSPDHATLARFRRRHQDAIAGLFGQVLGLCVRAGLVDVGVVAIDGTKIAADASFFANRGREELAAEILEEAEATDAAEDALLGDQRGGDLPDQWAGGRDRRDRIRAALDELDRQQTRDYESRMAERAKPDDDKLAVLAKVNRGELSQRQAGEILGVSYTWGRDITKRYFGRDGQRTARTADPDPEEWIPGDRTTSPRRDLQTCCQRRTHCLRYAHQRHARPHPWRSRRSDDRAPGDGRQAGPTQQHQPLPQTAAQHRARFRQLDFHGGELAVVDKELAVEALADPVVARLMTIPLGGWDRGCGPARRAPSPRWRRQR
jgi:hypothetical protein